MRLLRVEEPQKTIAWRCRVKSQGTVSQWRSGQKKPLYEHRVALLMVYGIPLDAWDKPPQPPEDAAPADAAPPSSVTSLSAPLPACPLSACG